MSERIAFYVATPDFCNLVSLSLASLLKHTPMDKVYILLDGSTFPDPLPPCAELIDVSGQTYFPHDGPNYDSMFSHVIMLRTVLPLMFPNIHTALSIDADTLITGDISPLWDIDLSLNYFAAVPEFVRIHGKTYFNIGIAMMNFDRLRDNHIPEKSVALLNSTKYRWPEQDVLNDLCRDRILPLPAKYNYAPGITAWNIPHSIRHYVGRGAKAIMIADAKGGNT